MNLLEQARKAAETQRLAKEDQESRQNAETARYRAILDPMRDTIFDELAKLDNQPCRDKGIFNFKRSGDFASLSLSFKYSEKTTEIATFSASIVKGQHTLDYGGGNYTEPRVQMRVPAERSYVERCEVGRLEAYTTSLEEVPEFLEKVASYLAKWV